MSASLRARGFAVSCDRCPAVLRTWSPLALGALVYAAERGWSVRLGVRQGAGPDVCPACQPRREGAGDDRFPVAPLLPAARLATTVCGFVCCPAWDPLRTALLRRDVCDGRGPSWRWLTAQGVASGLVRCEVGT